MQTRQEPSRSVYQLKDSLCVYYMGPEDTFCGNASVEVDGNLICWGGTMGSSQTYRHPDKLYILPVQVINPSSPYWLEATCSQGNIPPCTSGASMLCVDDKLILFGGFAMQWSNTLNEHVEDWTNKLYILSMSSLAWNDVKLPQEQYQPSPRDKCTSWIHRKMCYFFGGYGTAFDHIDPRLPIIRNGDQRLSDDGLTMWNNQLLQFDSKREKWIFVETIGLVPSPRAAAASCKKGRMVFIFGGRSGPTRLNDLFRMDMESLTWTPLETTNSPEGRSWCTLTTNSDSHLYLWGGMLNKPGGIENPVDDAYRISNDIYAVDVKARTWVKLNCCRFFRFVFECAYVVNYDFVFYLIFKMGFMFNSYIFLFNTVAVISHKFDAICFGQLDLDLPVRYLHIQIRENNKNITKSHGSITMHINSPSCRYVTIVLSSAFYFENSFISDVVDRGDDNGNLQPEKCNCPVPLDNWLLEAKCESEQQVVVLHSFKNVHLTLDYFQITDDLKIWKHVNFTYFYEKAVDSWSGDLRRRSFSFCHYQIIDNQIYRQCFGEYDGFKSFVDDTLRSITSKMILPNTEFLFNLGDYPLSSSGPVPIPIISWCGSQTTFDIVVPTYEMSQAILLDLITTSMSTHTAGVPAISWEKKHPLPIFRGRDSNKLRLSLAKLSDELPHLMDVGITDYFFHSVDGNPKIRNRMQFNEFFKHRYILSIDGTVAAYRFPFLLAGNSLIFKSVSPYYEHFYSKMQPFVHYIPFQLENIQDRIPWSIQFNHNKTIYNARQFVLDHLQPINFYCYYATLLKAI
uniref:CAP10 domain-containing protein n=1 Tax=Heterorhabditis bacteriophora TaxID=37862 RepID=A0A1I7WTU8_HETBA